MNKYGKLVRDNIPDIIRANGEEPVTRTLDNVAYLSALITKLKEEIAEFEQDYSIEELADIYEVTIAIRDSLDITPQQLTAVRRKKAAKNGRFKNRIYLESVRDKKT